MARGLKQHKMLQTPQRPKRDSLVQTHWRLAQTVPPLSSAMQPQGQCACAVPVLPSSTQALNPLGGFPPKVNSQYRLKTNISDPTSPTGMLVLVIGDLHIPQRVGAIPVMCPRAKLQPIPPVASAGFLGCITAFSEFLHPPFHETSCDALERASHSS